MKWQERDIIQQVVNLIIKYMISKSQLLQLASIQTINAIPFQGVAKMALMASDDHLESAPSAPTIIFNIPGIGSITSDHTVSPVIQGYDVSLSPSQRYLKDSQQSCDASQYPNLSIAQVLDPAIKDTELQKVISHSLNTPPNFFSRNADSAPSEFKFEQAEALRRIGVRNQIRVGNQTQESPRRTFSAFDAISSIQVAFQVEVPFSFPSDTPADKALNPFLSLGSIRMAQLCLAAAVSPICHILTAAGSVLSIPAAMISNPIIHVPDLANPDALPFEPSTPDQTTHSLQVRIEYPLTDDWSDAIIIGLSPNDAFASNPSEVTVQAGARPRYAVPRNIKVTHFGTAQATFYTAYSPTPVTILSHAEVFYGLGNPVAYPTFPERQDPQAPA